LTASARETFPSSAPRNFASPSEMGIGAKNPELRPLPSWPASDFSILGFLGLGSALSGHVTGKIQKNFQMMSG